MTRDEAKTLRERQDQLIVRVLKDFIGKKLVRFEAPTNNYYTEFCGEEIILEFEDGTKLSFGIDLGYDEAYLQLNGASLHPYCV